MTATKSDNKLNLDQTVATLFDSVTVAEAQVLKGKFDIKTITPTLLICMRFVGTQYKSLTGQQKKDLVIKLLQKICPDDLIDQLIPPLIDYFVAVDGGNLKINPTFIDNFCCCCKKKPVVPEVVTTSTTPSAGGSKS
jgi:hypothetical protein